MGLDLGAHAFVSHNVSLDGTVSVDHRWEYLRGTTPSNVPAGTAMLEADAGHTSFNRRFVASIGLRERNIAEIFALMRQARESGPSSSRARSSRRRFLATIAR